VYQLIVARQWLGRNVTEAMNTHSRKELLDESFYMRSVPYERKAGEHFNPELTVFNIFNFG
jgi:hypothetical protein